MLVNGYGVVRKEWMQVGVSFLETGRARQAPGSFIQVSVGFGVVRRLGWETRAS